MSIHYRLPLAIALLLAIGTARADSLFDHARQYTAQSGQEIRIGRHALWDRKCQARQEPLVHILAGPRNGAVTTRPGVYTVKQSLGSTICNGRQVSGIFVFYRSSPGFHGTDTIRYSVDIAEQPVVNSVSVLVQ